MYLKGIARKEELGSHVRNVSIIDQMQTLDEDGRGNKFESPFIP